MPSTSVSTATAVNRHIHLTLFLFFVSVVFARDMPLAKCRAFSFGKLHPLSVWFLHMAPEDLFAASPQSLSAPSPEPKPISQAPLAARMRPRHLSEYVGQSHILAPGQLLRRAIEADRIQSLIFYGPPGTGKTSLAQIIANQTKNRFERLSGVESNVADMRRVLSAAQNRLENTGQSTILFIDEIHRFNKAQQDVLLPDVESGVVRLIGATTHNPFFFVNSPLVSRSQIFELRPLTVDELYALLQRALSDRERGLGHLNIQADEAA